MANKLLVENRPMETRVALIEDDKLAEISIERAGDDSLTGNIYLGRVENILPGMQAAFVSIGMEKNAFLFAGDFQIDKTDFGADESALKAHLSALSIKKMLKVGQEILVQIIKMPGGDKGPRISSHITLPGRLVVLLPTVSYVGVSRRIEGAEECDRLRALARSACPEGMGLIVRTAAEGAEEDEIRRDVEQLTNYWSTLSRRARVIKAPALLHRDHDLLYRAIRDTLSDDIEQMCFEDEAAYTRARECARLLAHELEEKIAYCAGDTRLFDRYNVDKQLERALSRKIWLKSGGYLVFDRTEALTVVDVNTGKFVGKSSLSDTVFRMNMEAVGEIARQLRLRDLGGIIVIDFIDMDKPEQKEELLASLKLALKKDRTRTNVVGLTGLGLIEMTRKKKREPLEAILKRPCPHCQGTGAQLMPETVAYEVLGTLAWRLRRDETPLIARVSPPVAKAIAEIGAALPGRGYTVAEDGRADTDYEIEPANERALAPKTVRIVGRQHE